MLRKTLSALSASAVLAAATIVPSAALAFLPPPPPMGHLGPPPMAHLGAPPMAHLGGPPGVGRALPHASLGAPMGRAAGLSRFGGRTAGYGAGRASSHGYGRSASTGYGRSGRSSYDHGYSRNRHWGRYGVYGDASGASSSDGGCYYTYTSSGRRVAVCDDN
jgi:hypothetical protein